MAGQRPGKSTSARAHLGVALIVGLTFMVLAADLATVSVALPSLARDLRVTPASASWVIVAYSLASAGFLIAAGRAGDLFGPRRCLLAGVALFAGGATLAGLASGLGLIVAARVIQGLGSALVSPISFALLTTHLPEDRRPRAMGLFAVLQGVGALAGPLAGGWLTAHLGWRSVFFVSLPVMAAIAGLVLRMPADALLARERAGFDVGGLILVNATASLLLLAITAKSAAAVGLWLGGAMAALAGLVVRETRAARPLVPPSLFLRPRYRLALMVSVLLIASAAAFIVLSSLAMQPGLHMTPTQAGLGVAPYAVATILAGRVAPFLLTRWPPMRTMAAALGLMLAGLLLPIAGAGLASYWLCIVPSLVLCSSGIILCYLPMMAEGLDATSLDQQGIATGVLLTLQQLAAAAGAAGVLAVLGSAAAHAHDLAAFRMGYVLIAALVAVALALVGATIARRRPAIR